MRVLQQSLEEARALAQVHTGVIVPFSGGKDSRCTLDLAVRAGFKHIVPFHMYLVPGIKCQDEQLEIVKERYGLDMLFYPHWALGRCMAGSLYTWPMWQKMRDLQTVNLGAVYAAVRATTGYSLVFHGGKRSDSIWRKRTIVAGRTQDPDTAYPIQGWNKHDVLAYLKSRDIPIPEPLGPPGSANSGMGLHASTLLWLWDTHREDFERIEKVFPFIRTVVYRREWYGVTD